MDLSNSALLCFQAEECSERLQKCTFCELEVPWKQLEGHTVVCGSRTELCKDCGRYVKLSDQSEHSSTCSAAEGEDSTQTLSSALDKSTEMDQFSPEVTYCPEYISLLYNLSFSLSQRRTE